MSKLTFIIVLAILHKQCEKNPEWLNILQTTTHKTVKIRKPIVFTKTYFSYKIRLIQGGPLRVCTKS